MKEGLMAVEQPVFVKKKHELANLLKAVELGSVEAVELVVSTMTSEDEEVSLKTKLDLAKYLIDVQIRIADTISKDQLTRQIAEIKANGLKTPLALEPGQKRLPPTTDFNTIQEV